MTGCATDWSRGQGWRDEDMAPIRNRLRRAWFDLRTGHRLGFPLCCVLTYALGPLLGATHGARRRGGCKHARPDGTVKHWVPCRWHMRHGPNWQPYNASWMRARRAWLLNREVRRVIAELAERERAAEALAKAATRGVDGSTLAGVRDLLSDDHDVYVGIDLGGDEPAVVWHLLSCGGNHER